MNMLERILIYLDNTYQDVHRLKTVDQFNFIYPIIQNTKSPRNILEIVTNIGNLIRVFFKNDFISTGVDIRNRLRDFNNVILRVIDVTKISIGNFPNFSCVFMLSLHHQLISLHGESYTLKILNDLSNTNRAAIFIEFAALYSKYCSTHGSLFIDNDSDSIQKYAQSFLSKIERKSSINFLGLVREENINEPYRFLYMGNFND